MAEKGQGGFGLRTRLLALSCLLLTLPWFGYRYIEEMEATLQHGQEQAVASMAQALALTLNERPLLFNTLGNDRRRLYVYPLPFKPDVTDGSLDDWRDFRQYELTLQEGSGDFLAANAVTNYREGIGDALHYSLLLGENAEQLFLYINVKDEYRVINRTGALQIEGVDALHLALGGKESAPQLFRFAVNNKGELEAWRSVEGETAEQMVPDTRVQGRLMDTEDGYFYELSLPLLLAEQGLALSLDDVDDRESGKAAAIVATHDMHNVADSLQRPASELEKLLAAQPLAHFRVRVYDSDARLLFSHGDIHSASGLVLPDKRDGAGNRWYRLRSRYLHPLYEFALDWLEQRKASVPLASPEETSQQLLAALRGGAQSGYRSAEGLRTLEAAWPIVARSQLAGAIVVDQNLTALASARNQALSSLFDAMLAILMLTLLSLILFADSLSRRIRRLRDQTELSIDARGRLLQPMEASSSGDEIGDLSRSITAMVERLWSYNQYLENLTARLSHELRTPVTVVRSSLENLRLLNHSDAETHTYLRRAEEGISRLSLILNNMSEATRLEQLLQGCELQVLQLQEVFAACAAQYRQIYPHARFEVQITSTALPVAGSAEHLVQLLDKVVANAVEFSREGAPILLICKKDGEEAVMSVSNQGPTLDPAMKERIFDSMVSVRPQGNKGQPHLGLGLHIARLITDFHRGEIYAENLIGGSGVIVVIRLPLQKP